MFSSALFIVNAFLVLAVVVAVVAVVYAIVHALVVPEPEVPTTGATRSRNIQH